MFVFVFGEFRYSYISPKIRNKSFREDNTENDWIKNVEKYEFLVLIIIFILIFLSPHRGGGGGAPHHALHVREHLAAREPCAEERTTNCHIGEYM